MALENEIEYNETLLAEREEGIEEIARTSLLVFFV